MGYVPSGPIPFHGEGSYVPRRQHRRSRPTGNPDLDRRIPLGAFGELLAAWYLAGQGLEILVANLRVGNGEIDLVIRDGRRAGVVEVRTVSNTSYPLDAIDVAKRAQVRALAGELRISRCDALGIGVFDGHAIIHWDPDSF